MSRPRLHESLSQLFADRDQAQLDYCLSHPDFQDFLKRVDIEVPLEALREAFTHTSFSHEYQVPHQERLEFLGDAVLQLIMTQEIFQRFPTEPEGKLSKFRSTLVNEKTLAKVARSLGLSELLLVGKGEFKKNLVEQDAVMADTLEALLGQIYRYCGFSVAQFKFLSWLEDSVTDVWNIDSLKSSDPKSTLQEKSLAKYKKLPTYTSESQGENFLVKLWLNDELVAEGVFSSKRNGEKELASQALQKEII